MFTNIIVAVDGSETSQKACFLPAARQCQRQGIAPCQMLSINRAVSFRL